MIEKEHKHILSVLFKKHKYITGKCCNEACGKTFFMNEDGIIDIDLSWSDRPYDIVDIRCGNCN